MYGMSKKFVMVTMRKILPKEIDPVIHVIHSFMRCVVSKKK